MKKIIYLSLSCLVALSFCGEQLQAQSQAFGTQVFNDTILFQISRIDNIPNGQRYFMEFQTQGTGPGNPSIFSGIGVMSMCNCYCDSLWDAWPPPREDTDSLLRGGIGVLSYPSTQSSGGGSGIFDSSNGGRQRARLNVIRMPGSFRRQEPFPLQMTYRAN
ncbi:MAG: hypothetical protein AAF696_06645 [Bacteroidota bacterium]